MISTGYRCPLYDTALATTSDPPSVRAAQPSWRCRWRRNRSAYLPLRRTHRRADSARRSTG